MSIWGMSICVTKQHCPHLQIAMQDTAGAKRVQVEHAARYVLANANNMRQNHAVGIAGEECGQIAGVGQPQQQAQVAVVHGKAQKAHNVRMLLSRHLGQHSNFARQILSLRIVKRHCASAH